MTISVESFKIIAACCTLLAGLMGLFSLTFGSQKIEAANKMKILDFLNAFAGGVFLAVGLVHLLAEASKTFFGLEKPAYIPYTLCGASYFLMFALERVMLPMITQKFLPSKPKPLVCRPVVSSKDLNEVEDHHDHDHHHHHHHRPSFKVGHGHGAVDDIDLRCNTMDDFECGKTMEDLYCDPEVAHRFVSKTEDSPLLPASRYQSCPSTIEDSEEHLIHQHDTSHSDFQSRTERVNSVMFALCLFLVISVHALIAGVALGVQAKFSEVTGTFVAIILHKGVAALAIGGSFLKASLSRKAAIILLIVFSFVTPVGILIGYIISRTSSEFAIYSAMLTSFASGNFIYIAGVELREETACKSHKQFYRLLCAMFGFAIMTGVAVIE